MDTVWQDVRLALRLVRRSPGFAAIIVFTLALGIGANAAIFGVVNGLLLRPLPVADPHRLVTISSDAAIARGYPAGFGWTFAMWKALQPHADLFDGTLAWTPARFDLAPSGERQIVEGLFASGGYFATLGVPAILGRTFTAADDRPGGGAEGPVAVISYGLWQRRFGGAAGVIGGPLVVDGVTVTIVGVTPPEFFGVDVGRAFDVALPLETEPLIRGNRSTLRMSPLLVMLRLKPDQSIEAGTATLRTLQPAILGVTPEKMSTVRPPHNREPFTLVSAAAGTSLPVRGPTGLRQSYARPLVTILVVVLLVLLIACVNIANLLLARGTARRHELSVRIALGAPRARLARQLLIESLVFAALGAIGGFLIAGWGSQALVAQLSTPADRITLDLSLDWRTLAFTAGVALATVGIFGTVPAFRATRGASMDVLKMHGRAASRHTTGGGRLATLSSGLVIVQVALSLALVVAAALFVRSFERLSHVPLGFDPDRVLVVNVDTQRARTDPADRMHLYQRIVDAARSVPGVAHAGASMWTPVDGGMRMGDPESRVKFNFVTPGWFAAYGTAVRIGRDFTVQDTAEASPVVVVNEAFVRALMPGRFPLGETIPHPRIKEGRCSAPSSASWMMRSSIRRERGSSRSCTCRWRSSGKPTERADRDQRRRPPRGGIADAACTQRRRGGDRRRSGPRIHIPSADGPRGRLGPAGADRGDALRIVRRAGAAHCRPGTLRHDVVHGEPPIHRDRDPDGAGRAAGARARPDSPTEPGADGDWHRPRAGRRVGVTRYLRGMLFGLTPLDPGTFIGVAVLFAVVAAAAASIPAHRATRVDPLVALRTD